MVNIVLLMDTVLSVERKSVNKYSLSYTLFSKTDPSEPPNHKKYTFESENDLLAAADEGMCAIYDAHLANDSDTDVLFRSMVLDNAKEVYESLKPLTGDKDK